MDTNARDAQGRSDIALQRLTGNASVGFMNGHVVTGVRCFRKVLISGTQQVPVEGVTSSRECDGPPF